MPTILSPYPKPTKLSDPFYDWDKDTLTAILAKDEKDLEERDFGVILAPILPAANYEEGVYYLDGSFQIMGRPRDVTEGSICAGILYFIDYHQNRLRADGLLDACLAAIADLFQALASTFELIRLTDAELEDYGIREEYRELPKHATAFHSLVDALTEYEFYRPLLEAQLEWLNEDTIEKSCWWIQLSHHVRVWYVTFNAADKANARRQETINRLLNLRDYSFHMRKHRDHVRRLGFRQYEQRVKII